MKIYTNKQFKGLMHQQRYQVERLLVAIANYASDEMADVLVGNDKPRPDLRYKFEKVAREFANSVFGE